MSVEPASSNTTLAFSTHSLTAGHRQPFGHCRPLRLEAQRGRNLRPALTPKTQPVPASPCLSAALLALAAEEENTNHPLDAYLISPNTRPSPSSTRRPLLSLPVQTQRDIQPRLLRTHRPQPCQVPGQRPPPALPVAGSAPSLFAIPSSASATPSTPTRALLLLSQATPLLLWYVDDSKQPRGLPVSGDNH